MGLVVLLLSSIMVSCSRLDLVGMFSGTSPSIDERFEESMRYNTQHGYATLQAPIEDYNVYVCTDTHIDGTRKRWEYFIDQYRTDSLCPVAVHLGDIIDAKTDFDYVQDPLISSSANDTLMAVAGNHDIYFSQWRKFVAEQKEKELLELIKSENLKEEETRAFISDSFKNGYVKGLKAKGNITVDIKWENNKAVNVTLLSPIAQTISLKINDVVKTTYLYSDKETVITIDK